MLTQANFIQQFVNNYPETLQQIEQFRLKLENLIVDNDLSSTALEELVTTVNKINQILERFNNNKSREPKSYGVF
jgi:hypothetical protein